MGKRILGAAAAALAASLAVPLVLAQDAVKEIEKYREALVDGNPAELWEARGEDLWKKPAGPKNASLEKCDLGLGPGVVKGAYAKLPRYFADADRVMDLETRLVHCRMTLQGITFAEATSSRSAPATTASPTTTACSGGSYRTSPTPRSRSTAALPGSTA